MSDDHKDVLMSRRSDLISNMTLSDDVINKLISNHVLKAEDMQVIKRNDASESEKVQRFLDIFNRKPDHAYSVLIRILRSDGQGHVASILDSDSSGDEDDLNDSQNSNADLIQKLYPRLVYLLDLETGALDDLLSRDVITQAQYDNWSELSTSARKNEEFLTFVIRHCPPTKFDTILEVLNDNHQRHVVNFIQARGDVDREDDERVLTEDEVKRIAVNQKSFLDLLPTADIVPRLAQLGVIAGRHHQAVLCGDKHNAEKNRKLIEIIKRRSYRDIQKFCAVLQELDLHFLADTVNGKGVIAVVHAKMEAQNGPAAKHMRLDVSHEEKNICRNLNKNLSNVITAEDNEKHQYCRDISKLRDRNITLVNCSPTGSIAAYMLCSTRQAVRDVWNLMQVGVLRRYLGSIFAAGEQMEEGWDVGTGGSAGGGRGGGRIGGGEFLENKSKLLVTSLHINPEDCSLMFDYPWAADSRSPDIDWSETSITKDDVITPTWTREEEMIELLEDVRDKRLSVDEASRYVKDALSSAASAAVNANFGEPFAKNARGNSLTGSRRSTSNIMDCSSSTTWRIDFNNTTTSAFQFTETLTSAAVPLFGRAGRFVDTGGRQVMSTGCSTAGSQSTPV